MENGRGCWEISHGAWAQRAAKRRGHLGQTFSFFLFLSLSAASRGEGWSETPDF